MIVAAAGACTALGGIVHTAAGLRTGLNRARRLEHTAPLGLGEDLEFPIGHPVRDSDDAEAPDTWLELIEAAWQDLRLHWNGDPARLTLVLPDPIRFGALAEEHSDPGQRLADLLERRLGLRPAAIVPRITDALREPGLVLACDSWLDPASLAWLREAGRLERTQPGEAAVWLVLSERGPGPRICHAAQTAPGTTPAEAGQRWWELARLDDHAADHWCDAQGDTAHIWGQMAARLGSRWPAGESPRSIARACGDTGVAAPALAIACADQAWKRGWARHPRSVVWSRDEDGRLGVVVLSQG